MTNKILLIGGAVVIIATSFFGGMQYGKSKSQQLPGNFAGLSSQGRQFQQMNGSGRRIGAQGGGFVFGEVLSKDDKSITIKLSDGGSKIVFFSTSTNVMKSAEGSVNDIVVGEQVSVNGTANQDGSVTAQSMQIGGRAMQRVGQ